MKKSKVQKKKKTRTVLCRLTEEEYEDLFRRMEKNGFSDLSKTIRYSIKNEDARLLVFKKEKLKQIDFQIRCVKNYLDRLEKNLLGREQISADEILHIADQAVKKLEETEAMIREWIEDAELPPEEMKTAKTENGNPESAETKNADSENTNSKNADPKNADFKNEKLKSADLENANS